MNAIARKTVRPTRIKGPHIGLALLIALFMGGCGGRGGAGGGTGMLAPATDLGPTIGSLAGVSLPQPIAVSGYGLVGGLMGTGSAECPPQVRTYLTRYILRQVPEQRRLSVEEFINSTETAVVLVEGTISAVAWKGRSFDLRVTALSGTQTTSLEGGWLFGAELNLAGSFGLNTKVIADAKGPVFIDKISTSRPDKRAGYVLGGGTVIEEYNLSLMLAEPDFRTTANIRNRLNERFGDGTANAVLPGRIELTVPAEYRERRLRFLSVVQAMYLTHGPQITPERIRMLVRQLVGSQDKYAAEVALEAIGRESLEKLSILVTSADDRVRLHAGRCMLNLGSDAGLAPLTEIAMDKNSTYRLEALESITTSARRGDAALVCRSLLRDGDFNIRLGAAEQLRKLDDIALARELVARDFYLERITQTEHKAIFVSRSGEQRVILFGAPIYCSGDIFVQSADGNITINAPAGQNYVTIIRKHPTRPGVVAQLRSSFELGDIIRVLCHEPPKEGEQGRGGLGVSYTDMIVLLKQMCDKGAVRAEFRAGPLPKIG